MTRRQAPYDGVVVCAPVTVPYRRFSAEPAHWWAGRALRQLRDEAGLTPADIDGFCFASFSSGPDTAVGLTQHLGLCPRWLDHIPTGGASGVMALRRAARAVQCGDAELVVCLAADTNQIDSFRHSLSGFSRFSQDAVYPYGFGGPNATFALITDAYMREYGVTRAEFGKLCVAQRANAGSNPVALQRKPLSMEAYMAARPIADPVHLFDCVMPCAGAEAFIVTTPERAEQLKLPMAQVLATIERHNAFAEDPVQLRGGWVLDIDQLWEAARITPTDVDTLQVYDDYPVIVAMQIEDLGFCPKGEVARFIRETDFTIEGNLPLNTNGGQLSAGQAGAAGGFQNMTEGLRQILHRPLGAQVPQAKIAAVSGFGLVNFDRGVCTGAALLEALP
ncbi:thiolase family protein [Novosphingobium cyanobacteriorum]|uniref:Thiolase family protein n=1 Tax=Novosphingobium cyanobacteriorum TaxID=3024215 RepID=A0ABT6CL03_9SPHN|nr:thiolase family protein [Novosphingobium cyanobacteriorum]MDF8333750.1 thiolase family protein [Novosphingobium cyanobacteriorum]